tara:strand:+ start:3208 stop:3558 length:351 start_codon:yes stop_codon:yes gene_type:complete
MENSPLNIEPHQLKVHNKINNYNLTFLDGIFDIDISNYYNLTLSLLNFKIKNLYNYLFLRSLKLNIRFKNVRKMNHSKNIQSYEEFNNELLMYIQGDKLYAIIIMNGIQQYFLPIV